MTAVIEGVGTDAPIVANDKGGKQSHSPYRCDLLPPQGTLAVAKVLAHGAAKYGDGNWTSIPVNDHLNHAAVHLFAHLAGDSTDEHLEHFACRALMALDQQLSGRDKPKPSEDRRKRVYIAGPISKGNLAENVRQASIAFKELAEAGLAPWCPQWSVFSHPGKLTPLCSGGVWADGSASGNGMAHADWLAVDLAWVSQADAVYRLPGESTGADREVEEAKRLGIPVFYYLPALLEWAGIKS